MQQKFAYYRSVIKSNVTYINFAVPSSTNSKPSMSMCLMNTRSIISKLESFLDIFCENRPDLIAVTETWLSANDQAAKAAIIPCGYKLVDCPRVDRAGDGTALLFAQSVDVKLIDSGEKDSFEFSEYVMNSDNNKLRVCVIYRSTYSAAHPVTAQRFLSEFAQYLESVILSPELLLICGDFNIHVDVVDNHDTIAFLDLLESFALKQHVDFPTHEHAVTPLTC